MPPELAALLAVDTSLETEEGSLMDVLELLRQTTGGKPSIVVDGETLLRELGPPDAILVTLSLGESTLHDTLAALADVTGIVFVARDYGLLATTASRAFELYGATIPADAPILSDVVRARDR
jgi:hypothetical protein